MCSFCMGFAERRRQGSVLTPLHPIHSGCLSSHKKHIAVFVFLLLQTQDARSARDGAAHDGTASQHIHQGVVVADEIVAMKFLSAKTDEQFSQGVLHRNCSVCGVDRGIAAVVFFAHGELWIETNGNITRMSGAPGWSRAVTLPHQREMSPSFCTQRRQFEFLPPWWLALGAPVGCFARRPATESATKSMRVIRLADGAV